MESDSIISSINEIYERFKIMPSLQIHMMRVAAVAEHIFSSEVGCCAKIHKDDIVGALLLHDLGNIVKFNLREEPYWQKIQQEIITKYGSIDHEVTEKMIRELGVNDRVAFLISEMTFENLSHVIDSNDMELKICLYADLRVGPYGIVSIEERFGDLRKRYKNTLFESRYDFVRENLAFLLEQQIFTNSSLNPLEINDHTIAHYLGAFEASRPIIPLADLRITRIPVKDWGES